MNCDAVSQNLKALLDGELPRLQAWRVRRHLAHCADCRKEWVALQGFNAALRAADLFPPEAATPISARPIRVSRRLALGAFVTAALTVGVSTLVIGPLSPRRIVLAADVRAAVQRANVWHLTGWKLLNNRRVPWEIWRRQKPFFYREQVGGEMLLDDGVQRVYVIPPQAQMPAIVIRTTSRLAPEYDGWTPLDVLFGRGWDFARAAPLTRERVTFQFDDHMRSAFGVDNTDVFTVDKRTRQPIQYELRLTDRRDAAKTWTAEFLRADYDQILPRSVTAPTFPSGSHIVDTLRNAPRPDIPSDNSVSVHGLTVQVTPLAVDDKGRIVVRARAWLGDVPMNGRPILARMGILRASLRQKQRPTTYIGVGLNGTDTAFNSGPDNDQIMLLAPLEPLPQIPRLLPVLSLTLLVQPDLPTAISGLQDQHRSHLLFDESLTLSVLLPKAKAPVDYNAYLPSWLHQDSNETRWTSQALEPFIDESRARYYSALGQEKEQAAPRRREHLERAAFWRERAVAASEPRSSHRQELRLRLADSYRRLGEMPRARQILRQVIQDSQGQTGVRLVYRQEAQATLQTWAHL